MLTCLPSLIKVSGMGFVSHVPNITDIRDNGENSVHFEYRHTKRMQWVVFPL